MRAGGGRLAHEAEAYLGAVELFRAEALGVERGHRTLTITRKGGKVAAIPLAPRTARAVDLAIGERSEGPIFLAPDGWRLDRHGAARIVRRVARRGGIRKSVGPHTLRHAFVTAAQMSRIASDASFGGSRERLLPAAQRAARWLPGVPVTLCDGGDLGRYRPVAAGATMMHRVLWRGVHHGCAC